MKQKPNLIFRLSSLGIQMASVILIFGFLGNYLDKRFHSKNAYWTAGLLVFGVFVSLYIVIKAAMRNE